MHGLAQSSHPTIYAVAGAPASGKTTFVKAYLNRGVFSPNPFKHDCDEVMEALEEYQNDLKVYGSAYAFEKWEIIAREKAHQLLEEAVLKRRDIIYDRSCTLPDSLVFIRNLVEEQNYRLKMYTLHITEEEALRRARKREVETGRHIPEKIVKERLRRMSLLWPDYLALAEEAFLIDHTQLGNLRIIARFQDKKILIEEPLNYEEFLSIGTRSNHF
jgi:predicted ABC-type ATPase